MANVTSILSSDLISNAPSVLNGNFNNLNTDKAEKTGGILTSPSLLGTPVASTATAGSSNQQVANTQYVDRAVQNAFSGNTPTLITTSPYAGALTAVGYAVNSSVLSYIGLFQVPGGMTVNAVSLDFTTVSTSGSLRLGVYDVTGQTQVTSMVFASIAGTGMATKQVSSVLLSEGSYYYAISPLEADVQIRGVAPTNAPTLTGSVIGKPRYSSSIVTVSGALPTSFNPTTIPITTPSFVNIRLDN